MFLRLPGAPALVQADSTSENIKWNLSNPMLFASSKRNYFAKYMII